MSVTPPSFGLRLKQRRAALDLTQEALAERVSCAPQTIRKIESGERRPSRDMAERLAQVLQLGGDEREQFMREARAVLSTDAPVPVTAAPPTMQPQPRVLLPKYTRPFVGRAADLRNLEGLLQSPDCQLITLVGPGGIGKTRLAVEVATRAAQAGDGVFFVSLAPVTTPGQVASVIAEALGFAFHENESPELQLINYVREKELWLLIDNIEQVLEASDLLVELLSAAPGLRCLVTSRERLNVQGEWVVELAGLSARANAADGQADAVALFVERARRVRTSFALSEPELQHVVRVCELVDGMPLAIELAASWVRMLSCADIADEIQRNFDILSTSARDLPGRHQSLRAVFEHSWQLLSDEERRVLRQLTVFAGGFDRAAATEVAGASLPVLAALVDKSLLRRTTTARYDLHSLVRQYAAERLVAAPDEQTTTHERHARYYLNWLDQRSWTIQGRNQAAAIREIASEIDNIRGGWEWAARHHKLADMARALGALHWFFEYRTWFGEGETLFREAAATLGTAGADRATALMLGQLLASQGYFAIRSGHLERARDVLGQSLQLLRAQDNRATLAAPQVYLGIAAYQMGRYDEAHAMLSEGLAGAEPRGWVAALSLCFLGLVAHAAGEYDEARRLFREDLAIWRALDNARGMTLCMNFFSTTLFRLGEYDEAQALLHESLELCAATGDRWGLGTALNHLGLVAQAQGEQQQAHYLFNESLTLFKEMGERWAVARTYNHLGTAATALGQRADAKRAYVAALRTAGDANATPDALNAVAGLATVLAAEGNDDRALALSLQVIRHSASGNEARERAQGLQAELTRRLPAERQAAIAADADAQTLEQTVANLALAYHERGDGNGNGVYERSS